MYKSLVAHLKNKFPTGKVFAGEDFVDVYSEAGDHIIAVRKDGAGSWRDLSKELGLTHELCMAPIPKDARVWKLKKDGTLGLDELAEERREKGKEFLCKEKKMVKSIAQIQAEGGARFDDKGNKLSV